MIQYLSSRSCLQIIHKHFHPRGSYTLYKIPHDPKIDDATSGFSLISHAVTEFNSPGILSTEHLPPWSLPPAAADEEEEEDEGNVCDSTRCRELYGCWGSRGDRIVVAAGRAIASGYALAKM
ncbi:hypothetical protein BST61_g7547 [Cercospora zeina]